MKKTFLNKYLKCILIFIPFIFSGCEGWVSPEITFLTPFPKRSVNLSWVLGEQITLAGEADTSTLNISFDKKSRLNLLTDAITGDTITLCNVSRFRNYYYFSEKIADSAYNVYAVKLEDGQIRGMFSGHLQMWQLYEEVEKGNYADLVKYKIDSSKSYRLEFDRIKLRKFYQDMVDTLPALKILRKVETIEAKQDTIPADAVQNQWEKNGGLVKNIFPNPATDHFTIEFGEAGSFRIDLHNQGGQLLQTLNTNADKATLQTDDLKTGLYIIKVSETESGESANFKLLIRK